MAVNDLQVANDYVRLYPARGRALEPDLERLFCRLLILLGLLLRNLLSAGCVFLFLGCCVRLCLFLGSLLACGFRRFVAHKPNGKVRSNTRQLSGQAAREDP